MSAAEAGGPGKALNLSWQTFHEDAQALAEALRAKGPFSLLIAITRGGLVPAAIVARALDLRCIETISIASYGEENIRGEVKILKPIAADLLAGARDGQVLVIDDLADSGATLKIVRGIIPHAHVATPYVKPMGRPMVDTFVREVPQETWVHFPWEVSPAPVRGEGAERM